MVASDRVSVFDVVLPDEIPDKGRVLTGLSQFWFDQTARHRAEPRDLVRPHRLPGDRRRRRRAGRCSCARRGRSGSSASCAATCSAAAGRSTQEQGTVGGFAVPAGLRQAEQLPEPLFTPTTKAESGHDLPLTARRGDRRSSARDVYEQLRDLSLAALRVRRRARATTAASILADTKFEFGELDGEILVIDEMMTPDSSRYWPADEYARRRVAAVVRQAVRARLHGQHRLGPRAARAAHAARRDREHRARATARPTSSSPARASTTGSDPRATYDVGRYDRRDDGVRSSRRGDAPARDRRSGGRDRRAGAARARLHERRRRCTSARRSGSSSTRPTPTHARAQVEEMCERLLANPVIEAYEVTISHGARADESRASASCCSPARTASSTSSGRSSSSARPAEILWHGDDDDAAASTRSSSPAVSRTATTCAPARSRGSRR